MATVTVSIGRNIGPTPQGTAKWEACQRRTYAAVRANADAILFHGTGVGIWEDTTEDAYTVVANISTGAPLGRLRGGLEAVRILHDQEAIALTIGTTTLLGIDSDV